MYAYLKRARAGALRRMPSGAHVRAAMIANRAGHAGLQVVEGDVIGQVTRVKDGVVMAARVRAVDEDFRVSEGPLVGQRQRLIVWQEVRDRPRHAENIGTPTSVQAARAWGGSTGRCARMPLWPLVAT